MSRGGAMSTRQPAVAFDQPDIQLLQSSHHYSAPSQDSIMRRRSHDPEMGQSLRAGGDTQNRVTSYHETTFNSAILENLPSRQHNQQQQREKRRLYSRGRKRSHRRPSDVATIRLCQLDVTDMADRFTSDPDYTDQPAELQNRELKELPTNLAYKIAVRQEIKQRLTLDRAGRRPGWFKMLRYSIALALKRFNDNRAEVSYSLELWRGAIKTIEGNFGTGVTSYFLFLKWLFLTNLVTAVFLFLFVVMPRVLQRWLQAPTGYGGANNVTFSGVEIVTGGGWFTATELYYGDYNGAVIEIVSGMRYHMRFAYVCTVGAFYLLTVLILAYSLSKSYKSNWIHSSGGVHIYYALKIFTSWDYAIIDPKAGMLKQKGICTELQEYLAEARQYEDQRSCGNWCSILFIRSIINVLIVFLQAGSGYLVWYISISQSLQNDLTFLREMALPLGITAINFILPFAFSLLTTFEKYHKPRVSLYLTMLRTIVLNVVTLGVLIYFWFDSVDCYKQGVNKYTLQISKTTCSMCWETFMGQQLYRLVILDFIFILVSTFLSEFVRRMISQLCWTSLGKPEFNIGRNTLNLIYSQVLVWLGVFYSPLLSCIMVLKLFIIFYVKRVSVVENCVPSAKSWRGGKAYTAILAFLFAAFILCFVAVSYSVAFLRPSDDCGAYRGYNTSYAVLTDALQGWREDNKSVVSGVLVDIFTSTASIVAVFVVLCVIAYYTRRAAQKQKQLVQLLRNQISLECKEKLFLLKISDKINAGSAINLRYVPKSKPSAGRPAPVSRVTVDSRGASHFAAPPTGLAPDSMTRVPTSTPAAARPPGSRHPAGAAASPAEDGGGASVVRTLRGHLDDDGGSPGRPHARKQRRQLSPDAYNLSYQDRTLSADNRDVPPGGSARDEATDSRQALNPAYREASPTRVPNLPYPAQMYVHKP